MTPDDSSAEVAPPALIFDDLLRGLHDSGTNWVCPEDVLSMALLVSDLLADRGVSITTADGRLLIELDDVELRHLLPRSGRPVTEPSHACSSGDDLLVDAGCSLVSIAIVLYSLICPPRRVALDPEVLWPRYERHVTTALELANRIAVERCSSEL